MYFVNEESKPESIAILMLKSYQSTSLVLELINFNKVIKGLSPLVLEALDQMSYHIAKFNLSVLDCTKSTKGNISNAYSCFTIDKRGFDLFLKDINEIRSHNDYGTDKLPVKSFKKEYPYINLLCSEIVRLNDPETKLEMIDLKEFKNVDENYGNNNNNTKKNL